MPVECAILTVNSTRQVNCVTVY